LSGIEVGDELVIDGGMACFVVTEKIGKDLHCKCTDAGLFLPGAKFSFWRDGKLVRRNYNLPTDRTLSTKVHFAAKPLIYRTYLIKIMHDRFCILKFQILLLRTILKSRKNYWTLLQLP
jgi:hypothetical protein